MVKKTFKVFIITEIKMANKNIELELKSHNQNHHTFENYVKSTSILKFEKNKTKNKF